jgi:hypothetical protein
VGTKTPNELLTETVKRVPTNTEGVYGIELPPADFEPLTASTQTLLRYGFPLPPDPTQSPAAARLWRKVLSRPLTHVTPQLRLRPEVKRGPIPAGQGNAAFFDFFFREGCVDCGFLCLMMLALILSSVADRFSKIS